MRKLMIMAAVLAGVCGTALAIRAGEGGHTVLDLSRGSFRAFLRFKTPRLCDKDGKLKPLLALKRRGQKEADRKPLKVVGAEAPPKGWHGTEFPAERWPRTRGGVYVGLWYGRNGMYQAGNPAEWDLICLRGDFEVTNPSVVRDLKLDLSYFGGLVVYVNGKEIKRAHLPEGEIKPDTPATHYGDPAYLRPDNKLYGLREEKKFPDRVKTRTRHLSVKIPSKALRKGINVLGLEVHAAPVRDLIFTAKMGKVNWRGKPTPWPHAGVSSARLSAPTSPGLATRAGPSQGVKIYNAQPIESVEVWDYAHATGKPRPIRMVGARNGTFSGKVVLSSAGAISGLKASISDLKLEKGDGMISASEIKVRAAEKAGAGQSSWNVGHRFERLMDEVPAQVQPTKISIRGRKVQPEPAAVVPVWVTVPVPAGAKAGEYKGKLSVAAGGKKFEVPVELKVHDFRLPDPKDFVQRYNIYQSPESVAKYYKVELWSDKHFELMGKSFEVLHQIGSKVLVLNLACNVPSLGNRQSMVRWIKQKDGSYKHDFSIIDKYMDLYEKKCGKPAIVTINCWEHYKDKSKIKKLLDVTVYDPATKQVSSMPQPTYATPESIKFWKPVFDGLKQRLEKKKWYDVAAVCYVSYCWPPQKELVDAYRKLWPDGKWMNCSHSNPSSYKGSQGSMPVPYSEWVWGCGGLYNPDSKGRAKHFPRPWTLGTKRIQVGNPRYGVGFIMVLRDYSPLSAFRFVAEGAMQGNVRGLGRVGGDFWPVDLGDKRGRRMPMCTSYAAVGPVNNCKAVLCAGPQGAVFSERLEMFREGVQAVEAIARLQMAIVNKKVDAATAAKIEKLLDERARYFLRTRRGQAGNWFSLECSRWQERDDALYKLCAEVVKDNGAK
jgi:hypothetical protein